MPISDYRPPKKKIEFPGGSFEVRAMSAPDVAILIDSHQWAIQQLYLKLRANANGPTVLTEAVATEMMMELIREAPTLVGNLIALAADETDAATMRIAAGLPLPVQMEALRAIGEVTFNDIASVKKFGADVMMLLKGILPAPTETPAAET